MAVMEILQSLVELFKSQSLYSGTALVFIVTLLLASQIWSYFRRGPPYPPGPRGLPIVGYLPFIMGKDLHKVYYELSKKYGPIFSLRLGTTDTVIINDFEGIRESGKLDELSGRPPAFFAWDDKVPHIGNMSGQPWKDHRRFFTSTLRNVGMSQLKVESSIQEQISACVEGFKRRTSSSGNDVNLRDILGPAINNIITSLIYGKTYDTSDKMLAMQTKFQHAILSYFEEVRMVFFFPFLDKLYQKLSSTLAKNREVMREHHNAMLQEVNEHRKLRDQSDEEKKDYMDYYLNESKSNPAFNEATLVGNSQLFLMAGGETTRSTLEFTILLLARHQLLQDMIHKQIIEVLGTDKQVEWKDREQLPLVLALIYEVIRYKTLVCVNDPHQASKDTELCGFKIKKGTVLFTNLWAVNYDKEFWGDPENFRPERFLSKDLKTIVNRDRIVSFGHGKRICPGEKLAEVETFLFTTSLLQKFRFLPSEKGVSLESYTAITEMAIHPVVRVEIR